MNPLSRWRLRRRLVREAVETYRAVQIAERFFESGKGRVSDKETLRGARAAKNRSTPRPPQLVEDWRRGMRR